MKKPILLFVIAFISTPVFAQVGQNNAQQTNPNPPKVASRDIVNTEAKAPNEHPLVPVLKWAKNGRSEISKLKDYTAILTKQENIGGEVKAAQMMDLKVRHEPFSVYLKFRYPKDLAGQEVIYIKGQNDGKLLGHGVGLQKRLGTMKLDPEGFVAMKDNKYPITEIGILNLVDKLIEVGEKDSKFGECEVEYFEGIKMDERECTMIQVKHPVPRKQFLFYIARIVIDNEHNVPVRYESYEWPTAEGKEPTLIEVYTYQKFNKNVGLTDADFSTSNPKYSFER